MRRMLPFGLLILTLHASGSSGAVTAEFEDDEACLLCHKYPMLARTTGEGVFRSYYVMPDVFAKTVHRNVPCRDCHTYIEKLPHGEVKEGVTCNTECHSIKNPATGKPFSHKAIYQTYEQSVHGRAKLAQGAEADKPYCIYCHTNPLFDPSQPVPPKRIADRCEVCHEDRAFVERWYNHTSRRIREVQRSPEEIVAMCSTCHGDEGMVERRLRIAQSEGRELGHKFPDAVESYEESFHGKLTKRGLTEAADCLDCHADDENYFVSVHEIRPSRDPESPVAPAHLVETCQRCHVYANESFVRLDPHPTRDRAKNPLRFHAEKVFSMVGNAVILGLVGLSFFETIGRWRDGVAWRLRRGTSWRRRSRRGRDRVIDDDLQQVGGKREP